MKYLELRLHYLRIQVYIHRSSSQRFLHPMIGNRKMREMRNARSHDRKLIGLPAITEMSLPQAVPSHEVETLAGRSFTCCQA